MSNISCPSCRKKIYSMGPAYYCNACDRYAPDLTVPISGALLKILSGYWEGQGDPLYAICSRAVADGANMDRPGSCGNAHNATEEELGRVFEVIHMWLIDGQDEK